MTVIAVRDGIMAVDSQINAGELKAGTIQKWRAVPECFGGGYIAAAGDAGIVGDGMDAFCRGGEIPPKEGMTFIHLRADGVVRTAENGAWFAYDAPFYAEGSGAKIAIGAMAAGASSTRAVEIACEYDSGCGGEVATLSVQT